MSCKITIGPPFPLNEYVPRKGSNCLLKIFNRLLNSCRLKLIYIFRTTQAQVNGRCNITWIICVHACQRKRQEADQVTKSKYFLLLFVISTLVTLSRKQKPKYIERRLGLLKWWIKRKSTERTPVKSKWLKKEFITYKQ